MPTLIVVPISIPVELRGAMREDVVNQLSENRPSRSFEFIHIVAAANVAAPPKVRGAPDPIACHWFCATA
jgi:hypothetical protein